MNKTNLTTFEQTLQKIDEICNQHSLDYIVIGGVAIMYHLEYRTTKDVDISLKLDLQQIRPVGELFLNHFNSVYDDPLDFFKHYFVLPLIDPATKIRVDISAGLGGFEHTAVERSTRVRFSDVEIKVCTAEDLIIFKLVAARPIDLADAEMLIQKYLNTLDKKYLLNTAYEFTHFERSDILERLKNYFNRYQALSKSKS